MQFLLPLLKKILFFFTLCCLVTQLSACSHFKKQEKEKDPAERSAEEIYNEAMDKLEARSYKKAVELFETVEREHPYSKWATKAQVMAAYTNYTHAKYDDAIIVVDRFIKLHPGNQDVAYMYYLRALSYYEQISDIKRDQKASAEALQALKEVIARFPESEYARDVKVKIDLVNDHLAGKELEIGRFYLRKNKLIAAVNRFRAVVEDYQTTSHTPEALYRLTAAYWAMGIKEEAKKYAAVLGHNFPDSKWYKYSYSLLQGKTVKE